MVASRQAWNHGQVFLWGQRWYTEWLQSHDISAGATQCPRLKSDALPDIANNAGKGLWEKLLYTKLPFSGMQGS